MKATLIFPGITIPGFNSFRRVRLFEANYINHGLASISAYAKKKGHQIDLIDLRTLKNWADFGEQIKKRNPPIVGITFMSVDFDPAMKCIQIINDVSPKTLIVVGGVHSTVMVKDIESNPQIDFIITGEGEISFSALLESLENNITASRIIKGETPDLSTLPWVDRDLFDYTGELNLPWMNMPTPFITINAGRGCPYRCTFFPPAERMVFGNRTRMRPVDDVTNELSYLHQRYQFKSLMIHDDLFTYNPKWVFEFCDSYQKKGFTQNIVAQARVDNICKNPDMIKRLSECGLKCLLIGFESGSQRILDLLKKGTTIEQNLKAADICHRFSIKIFANYMLGIPTETKEEVMQTINMIKVIKPDHHSPSFFTPYPGSELYDYILQNNLSLIKSHNSYRRNPDEPKIKGVDYQFINKMLNTSYPPRRIPLARKIASKLKHFLLRLLKIKSV